MIGFFAPDGVDPAFAGVRFAQINPISPAAFAANLQRAEAMGLTVHLTTGGLLITMRDPESLQRARRRPDGTTYHKRFDPLPKVKVRRVRSDDAIEERMAPYVEAMRRHPRAMGCVFLPDEPYLNGIPRPELERAARTLRAMLDAAGLDHVGIGVNFAAGMFDAGFARDAQEEAWRLAEALDAYAERLEREPEQAAAEGGLDAWLARVGRNRLTTYDMAGNMWEEGGIPDGVDLVSFDFYLPTLLNDRMFGRSLAYLAESRPSPATAPFAGRSMAEIRRELTYLSPRLRPDPKGDRRLLDALFRARNDTLLAMLREQARACAKPPRVMVMSRSGENGAADAAAEARVMDEVERALALRRREGVDVMFFAFSDIHDSSIRLDVGGVARMPRVLGRILDEARGTGVGAERPADARTGWRRWWPAG